MTTGDKNRDEKLQYGIKWGAAKIPALSSRKIDKYDFLTGKEILPPDQRRVMEQAKFTDSSLRKSFLKQTKTNEEEAKINRC